MTEPTTDERLTVAAERTAKNTELLLLIAQVWSIAAVIGGLIALIVWVKSSF